MLAHLYAPKRITFPCHVQPKLNGVRALYQSGCFQSRDEIPWDKHILSHISKPLREIFGDATILDGELYVHGWPLQRINGAIATNRHDLRDDTHLVEFHVFDVVDYRRNFISRFTAPASILTDTQHLHKVKVVETHRVADTDSVNYFYAKWVELGYEGLMYRLADCPYTTPSAGRGISDKNNRTWHLLKRKDYQDAEFRIVDVVEGDGKRTGMVGAFICQTSSGTHFKVGTGLSDNEAVHYLENPPIGKLLKVKYLCLTENRIPFNPVTLAVLE